MMLVTLIVVDINKDEPVDVKAALKIFGQYSNQGKYGLEIWSSDILVGELKGTDSLCSYHCKMAIILYWKLKSISAVQSVVENTLTSTHVIQIRLCTRRLLRESIDM